MFQRRKLLSFFLFFSLSPSRSLPTTTLLPLPPTPSSTPKHTHPKSPNNFSRPLPSLLPSVSVWMIAALLDLTNVNSSLLSLPPSRLGSTRGTSVTKPPLAGILSKVRRNAGAGRTGGERRGRPSSDGTTSSTAGGSDAEDEDLKAGGEGGRGNLRKKKSWILVMESLGRKSSRSDLRREEKWLEDDTEDVQEQEEIGMRCESLGRKFVLVRTTTEIKVTSDVSQKLGNTVVSRSSFSRSTSLPLLISELNTDSSSNLLNLPFSHISDHRTS